MNRVTPPHTRVLHTKAHSSSGTSPAREWVNRFMTAIRGFGRDEKAHLCVFGIYMPGCGDNGHLAANGCLAQKLVHFGAWYIYK